MTVCAAVYRNLAVLAAEALAFTQALGRLGERGRAPAMRSAINFTVLPSVSLALAHADAAFAASVGSAFKRNLAALASVARTLARATTIRFDRSVLAAVNLATIASVPRALTDTFSRLA